MRLRGTVPGMVTRAERLAQLEAEIDEVREEVAAAEAKLNGRIAEYERLRRGVEAEPPPVRQAGTLREAVLAVLHDARGARAPAEILAALHEAGREVPARSIGGTLNSLKRDGLVKRVGSKQWVAM